MSFHSFDIYATLLCGSKFVDGNALHVSLDHAEILSSEGATSVILQSTTVCNSLKNS